MMLRPAAEHRRTHLSLADFSGTPCGKRRCLGDPRPIPLGSWAAARHALAERAAAASAAGWSAFATSHAQPSSSPHSAGSDSSSVVSCRRDRAPRVRLAPRY